MLLSLPRSGPRHGPTPLTVYASSLFFARKLAEVAQPGDPPAALSCALVHTLTGERVVLSATLSEDGTSLACPTLQPGPLTEGVHDVLVSFNGVEYTG